MNSTQTRILIGAAVLVCAMLLYVPRVFVAERGAEASAGYSLIFMRPYRDYCRTQIDLHRLVPPILVVGIAAACAFHFAGQKKPNEKTSVETVDTSIKAK
jgi:ABC-type uncharacterized transport system permease subunit